MPNNKVRLFALALVALFLAAACGGGSDNPSGAAESSEGVESFNEQIPPDAAAYPVFVSSELAVGENRFLIGLLDDNDAPIGDPSIDVSIAFYDLDSSATEPVAEKTMDFLEAVPGERGLYVTEATFEHAGKWGAEVTMKGGSLDESVKGNFEVLESTSTPAVGAPVPKSDTPTESDVKDLSTISSDPHPDARFYEESIAEAVKKSKTLVVVFATPKFCTSQVCGPTLDIVKGVAPDFPKVEFIHVEVYSNLDDPSNLKPVPATKEWGLPSEPWVFVVDSRGRLDAKYEGVIAPTELRRELTNLR